MQRSFAVTVLEFKQRVLSLSIVLIVTEFAAKFQTLTEFAAVVIERHFWVFAAVVVGRHFRVGWQMC